MPWSQVNQKICAGTDGGRHNFFWSYSGILVTEGLESHTIYSSDVFGLNQIWNLKFLIAAESLKTGTAVGF